MFAASRTSLHRLFALGLCLFTAPASGQIFEEFMGAPPPARTWLTDDQVAPAALFQPPALSQPTDPIRSPAPSRSLASRQRLASVPNMFGDFGMMTATVQFIDVVTNRGSFGSFDVPGAGGSRRVKIAENDSPLPQDRVFFMYNHFHNVYEFQENQFLPGPQTFQRQQPIDRYTFGLEKTFLDGDWSVELRLPLNGSLDAEGNLFAVSGGQYGNLAVIVKRLLYDDDVLAIGAGIGIDTPTGSQAQAEIGQNVLTFENESVHVLPYLGLVWSPADSLFVTGFLQVDVSTSGSDVVFTEQGLTPQPAGRFNEQNLLFADVGVGYWLYQNPYAEWLTGVAALLEFHYTTALQDTDSVLVERGSLAALISNPVNRFDVVNVSAGVNIDIGETANLRVAGVFPLGDAADNRFFDSEVQVQFNQRF